MGRKLVLTPSLTRRMPKSSRTRPNIRIIYWTIYAETLTRQSAAQSEQGDGELSLSLCHHEGFGNRCTSVLSSTQDCL
jgi:hypothetical protein